MKGIKGAAAPNSTEKDCAKLCFAWAVLTAMVVEKREMEHFVLKNLPMLSI